MTLEKLRQWKGKLLVWTRVESQPNGVLVRMWQDFDLFHREHLFDIWTARGVTDDTEIHVYPQTRPDELWID